MKRECSSAEQDIALAEIVNQTGITSYKALSRVFEKTGMYKEDAEYNAELILSYFGFENCIIDNVLSPKIRDIFYFCEQQEDLRILTTENEIISTKKHNAYRLCYWHLKLNRICDILLEGTTIKKEENNIYSDLPEEYWPNNRVQG